METYVTQLMDGSFQINVPHEGKILTAALLDEFKSLREASDWLLSEAGKNFVRALLNQNRPASTRTDP